MEISPLDVAELIYDGTIPDVKPSAKRKLKGFVQPVRVLRKLAEEVGTFYPFIYYHSSRVESWLTIPPFFLL